MVMTFENLDAMCIGELVRFKDRLIKEGRITEDEYNTITKFLGFIINEED